MKRIISLLTALLLILTALPVWADPAVDTVSTTAGISNIQKYGNVVLDLAQEDFTALGYTFGDVVTVSFLGKEIDMPFCSNYSDVDTGASGLFARSGDPVLIVAINMGDFATANGIATKETFPDKTYVWHAAEGVADTVTFTISMKEPGAYYEEYVMHALTYTDNREDYADLSDEQFANFREIATTGMGKGRLYRSATPVNPERNRNTYVDAALRKAGIKTVVNLADDTASAKGYEGYDQSYYSGLNTIELNLGVDFSDETNRKLLGEGLRFMIRNEGPYDIHCLEGKDRAGFVAALLECLMGAGLEEVRDDYMVTYFNYYGVTKDDVRYDTIASGNIEKNLKTLFGVSDLAAADLSACAKTYIRSLGLTDGEIEALQKTLAEPVAEEEPVPVSEPTLVVSPLPVTEVAEEPAAEPLPVILPAPAADPASVTYTVVKGDCLWNLAKKYYGTGTLYTRLAEANHIANPNLIFVGQELIIPQ